MTDNVTQILQQWKRPAPPADFASRIIASAAVQPKQVQRPLFKLALAASLVLALAVGYLVQGDKPVTVAQQQPVQAMVPQQFATIDGVDVLADVEFFDEDEFAFLDGAESL